MTKVLNGFSLSTLSLVNIIPPTNSKPV
ncbi:hypothetical protein L150_06050 [Candida albicans Ca529L]|nr:hypothetical protein L150_06050 [Candida albicans Ca529L]